MMGKAQKIKVSKKSHPVAPSAPLADQLASDQFAAASGRTKERRRLDEDEDFVESRLSKNIISQARIQVVLSRIFLSSQSAIVKSAASDCLMSWSRYSCGRTSHLTTALRLFVLKISWRVVRPLLVIELYSASGSSVLS